MHIVANEPSLAFYRLQEHVRKALNPMVDRRVDIKKLHQELQGRCYDIEYAVGYFNSAIFFECLLTFCIFRAIKAMDKAEDSFKSIQDHLKNAIFLKQQLKYEESRRKKADTNSVYKRLSAHITIDLPELPELSDVVRETANKVESMMSKATHS